MTVCKKKLFIQAQRLTPGFITLFLFLIPQVVSGGNSVLRHVELMERKGKVEGTVLNCLLPL